jgi:serine/threonine protein kinase
VSGDRWGLASARFKEGSREVTPERWQEVKKVLAGALERKPEQRRVYLDEACTDPDLRREVETLIAAHEQGDSSFMDQPADHPGPLPSGTKLGPYTILARIGSGGMGEVYRAHDTKLKRDVAIKVLPQIFVNDSERLARLEREARVLASLNHPYIATIHGVEDSGKTRALIMELAEGPTLADRLRSGPFNCTEALKISSQIAEALESAHEKGVIHRDLKPANVKLTREGRVKVLDFGLAKAFADNERQDLSHALTVTTIGTDEGRILGTPAYMSPEQARGKTVDKRTDIWAFGCLLYELLTAQRAFPGQTLSDTIVGVLEQEPNWQALPPAVPLRIRNLLRPCLQKDPQRRLRDLGDAQIEIEDQLTALPEPSGTASKPDQNVSSQHTSFLRRFGQRVTPGCHGLS